jgi:hypothetical protein
MFEIRLERAFVSLEREKGLGRKEKSQTKRKERRNEIL